MNEYYNALSHAWLQLDLFEVCEWDTTKDAETYRKAVDKRHTLHFLLGLYCDLDDAKGRVMATKPFPEIEAAVAEVRGEELRRNVMLYAPNPAAEGSALQTAVFG